MINSFNLFPLFHWAKQNPKMLALCWEKDELDYFAKLPTQLTWEELECLLHNVANLFHQKGIHSNSLVAYSGTHHLCGLLTYCTTIAMGAKILMLNPAQTAIQQQMVLEKNGVDFFIKDEHFANFSKKITACQLFKPLDFSKAATLTLTSGSTGMPKAVVHSISAHLASAEGVCELMNFNQNSSWLLSLPLFHVSGQAIIWRWLLKGGSLYTNQRKDSFFEWLKKVTHSSLVPTQLQRYLAKLNTPISQKCLLGGTNIPAELIEQAQQYGITTFSGYGMTEMASTICAVKNELDNVGVPLTHREVKLENSEIWVRGKNLALGYWQKNNEIQPLVNDSGWFQTKDRGEWNSKKQLVIKGRLDNMFISGGENIQPEEIEQIIFQSNLVEQAFILPIEDKEFGRRPVAILALKNNDIKTETNKLKIWLSDKLEKFKQPVAYYLLDAQQYQQQGSIKISRNQLQEDLKNRINIKEIYV
ncbi:o-succinylbenzoate--CoA ligase [Mannheimia sp. AT1]|uniref:O-succinylbenzoate--CoA ligase n=1 Tax=Mannheimia cairinae TaxID=3025936 RepID=A0ABT5MRD7_9PAST|nr:o-succinylbenzoate--CoA ligase [Mannheimia cairinae]MDD0824746.1 o-succinylbenzoate--CoA ligase [Mannheimia cairinae]MDD0826325.1 o-succinylbenzoate--CoA ligase [Mannheimia cairinae]